MLLDTSGLLCCFDASEARHAQAVALFTNAAVRFTHNYILAEFVALASARHYPREPVLRFVWELANSNVLLEWVTPARHQAAMTLLLAQIDKRYSLADAVSFVLMRERRDAEALTTDAHFDQAGLRRLLPV